MAYRILDNFIAAICGFWSSSLRASPCRSTLGMFLPGEADETEEQMQHGQSEGTPKSRAEGGNGKARYKVAGEPENHCIDDQEEDAEGEDAQRQRDDLEEEPQRRVEQTDDDDSNECRDEAADMKALDEVRDEQQSKSIQYPVQNQSDHRKFPHSVLVLNCSPV